VKTKELCRQVNIRLPVVDLRALDDISERLDLQRSEIMRRAVREGIKAFRRAMLPGSPAVIEESNNGNREQA
jgi:metal-responsive CopG/Arc/MetJ family transcriptional regulator